MTPHTLAPTLARAFKSGLCLSAFYILLRARQTVGLTDLYADLDVSAAAITQMVRKLRRRGLVRFVPHGQFEDRRMKEVVLTEAGEEMLTRIMRQ